MIILKNLELDNSIIEHIFQLSSSLCINRTIHNIFIYTREKYSIKGLELQNEKDTIKFGMPSKQIKKYIINSNCFIYFYLSKKNNIKLNNYFLIVKNNILNSIEHQKIIKLSMLDPLTKTLNRNAFIPILKKEIANSKKYKYNLSLITIDIDNFKSINDEHGHIQGDKVLINLTNIVKNSIRKTDYFMRSGGDEFMILLTRTNEYLAKKISNRITRNIKAINNINLKYSISIGISILEEKDSIIDLLTRSDQAMYSSKNNIKVFM